jgi:hypothetical protein
MLIHDLMLIILGEQSGIRSLPVVVETADGIRIGSVQDASATLAGDHKRFVLHVENEQEVIENLLTSEPEASEK